MKINSDFGSMIKMFRYRVVERCWLVVRVSDDRFGKELSSPFASLLLHVLSDHFIKRYTSGDRRVE